MKKISRIFTILISCTLVISAISTSPTMTAFAAATPPVLTFTTIVSGLNNPVLVTNAGDGSKRLFIVDQDGQILVMDNGNSTPNSTPFLDISGLTNFTSYANGGDGEQGLLGLAFAPDYASSGNFYIVYTTHVSDSTPCPSTAPTNGQNCPYTTTLASYHATPASDVADPTGTVLLVAPKVYVNHNGSMIAFGPDGYLYMSIGDGGSGGDPDGNGQSLDTFSAKILRLNVNGSSAYTIPSTNPFYGDSDPNVKQEIWAYGLRNPWRFSFDKSTGDLYIGDVGQDRQEEVDFQSHTSTGGENYGWGILEGNLCYNPSSGCVKPSGYVAPVATYNHGSNDSIGCAIMGGYVYRGTVSKVMQGWYLYGDDCSGRVWGLFKNSNNSWTSKQLASTGYNISSFGEDEDGELYLTDLGGGQVVKISQRPVTVSFKSQGSQDGYITESAPSSGTGGTLNASAGTFTLGDTADNRQYRGILSFNTATLPDTATITSATLKIRRAAISNPDPFSQLGNLSVDLGVPFFGASSTLESGDFEAASTMAGVATFNSTPVGAWYSAPFTGGLSTINLTGTTQLRLEFDTPTNSDGISNYATFNSGNAVAGSRPVLIIQYIP